MGRRVASLLAASAMLAVLSFSPARGQVLYGSIVGTTEDPTGAVVPGTLVTLTSAATGATREVKADDQGRYSIANVLPGLYTLKFTAPGFRTLTRTGVEVTANAVTRVDARLEVG